MLQRFYKIIHSGTIFNNKKECAQKLLLTLIALLSYVSEDIFAKSSNIKMRRVYFKIS